MPDLSAELGLALALGGDDTRDYLRGASPSLRSSLQIIDGLFNQSTGHTHNGAHQGGALSFQDLTIGNNLTVMGASDLHGTVHAFSGLQVDGAASVGSLSTGGSMTVNQNLAIGGTLNVTGQVTTNAIGCTTLTASGAGTFGGALQVNSGNVLIASGILQLGAGGPYWQATTATQMQTNANLGTNGVFSANGRITTNADILIGPNSTAAVLYLGSDGSVYFQRYEDGSIGRVIHAIAPNGILAQGFCPEGGNGFFAHSDRPGAPGNEVKAESHLFVRGSVWCTNVQQTSAEQLKSNIVDLTPTEALSLVLNPTVSPFRYTLDTPPPPGGGQMEAENFGFGATAMSQVCPEVVALGTVNGVDDTPMAIDYPSLVPVLWSALRALDARLSALEGV